MRPDAKPYTARAGLKAVRDALERRRWPATAEHHPIVANTYRVRWTLPDPPPLVSLIIPTRDGLELLQSCVAPLLERTRYRHLELILVDNDSRDREALAFLDQLVRGDGRARVLRFSGSFNFSAINNAAVAQANGELVALVNNDVTPIEGDWLEQMIAHAVRPDVGCVGAKLLYPDDRIQHAGVILGLGGVAGHAHRYLPAAHGGYFARPHVTHTVSAVTAACMVVKKALYQTVGGMDEEKLSVAFNDVDLCLKIGALGKRNLFVPGAVLYHHESASRGSDMDPANAERFKREIAVMEERWNLPAALDAYYSPHLALVGDFELGRDLD
jgi:GT2 family glycosyltransferase